MSSMNGFPFTTRKQILTRLESEPAFAVECVRILDEGRRWMASHRSRATKLLARLAVGAPSAEVLAEAVALAQPYARTLSRLAREKEIAERPELLTLAAMFSVVRPSPAPAGTAVQTEAAAPAPVFDTPVVADPVVVPKRRGRPPGSKNKKPRSDLEEPKRRRRRA